jgi:hypothetical protein
VFDTQETPKNSKITIIVVIVAVMLVLIANLVLDELTAVRASSIIPANLHAEAAHSTTRVAVQ